MPKYYPYLICGYYLYFTAHCIVEAMHVHANKIPVEYGAAKFFVKSNGDTTVEKTGSLSEKEIKKIRAFIKDNYEEMYKSWKAFGGESYYGE